MLQHTKEKIKRPRTRNIHELFKDDLRKITPLHLASHAGELDTVLDLLQQSSTDINAEIEGVTALHFATEQGHVAIVRVLIRHLALINATTNSGLTALIIAIKKYPHIALYLLDNGANVRVTFKGHTALYYAAECGQSDIADCLLAKDALDTPHADGTTALHAAARHGHAAIVTSLLIYDQSHINATCEDKTTGLSGITPLHLAAASLQNSVVMVKHLFDQGALLETCRSDGATPLLIAAENGRLNTVRYLFACGANIHATRNDGATALDLATLNGHQDTVDFLLSQDADELARASPHAKIKSAASAPSMDRRFDSSAMIMAAFDLAQSRGTKSDSKRSQPGTPRSGTTGTSERTSSYHHGDSKHRVFKTREAEARHIYLNNGQELLDSFSRSAPRF